MSTVKSSETVQAGTFSVERFDASVPEIVVVAKLALAAESSVVLAMGSRPATPAVHQHSL
jgi:hypothetical protein